MTRFERFVAIGDSTVEGLDDPDGRGGYRGWANRLAERIARDQGDLRYANLAIRGRTTRDVMDEQLGPALVMKPDLAIVVAGTNDILRPRFHPEATARTIETMQRALIDIGATVVSFTLPDLTPVMPLAWPLRPRIRRFAAALVAAGARSGARVIDFTAHPVASDPRLWSGDRLHANSAGHARIAAALAEVLSLPEAGPEWSSALPEPAPPGLRRALAAEFAHRADLPKRTGPQKAHAEARLAASPWNVGEVACRKAKSASIAAIGPSPRRCTRWCATTSKPCLAPLTMGPLRCASRNTRDRSFLPTSIAGFYAAASPD